MNNKHLIMNNDFLALCNIKLYLLTVYITYFEIIQIYKGNALIALFKQMEK